MFGTSPFFIAIAGAIAAGASAAELLQEGGNCCGTHECEEDSATACLDHPCFNGEVCTNNGGGELADGRCFVRNPSCEPDPTSIFP